MTTHERRRWSFVLAALSIIGLSWPRVEASGRLLLAAKRTLFVFGDSYVDDGNLPQAAFSFRNPYGITRPGYPTGRFSDGRVLSDFIAKELGVKPPVPFNKLPRLSTVAPSSISNGLNFAEGGSGVFPVSVGVDNLTVQIQHFQVALAAGLYSSSKIATSYALVSISGNDYFEFLAIHGYNDSSIFPLFIASVVKQIAEDMSLLYAAGVRNFILPNLHPAGCLPSITGANNFTACTDSFNALASLHNQLLQAAIAQLKTSLPASSFLILDQFKGFGTVLADLSGFGFSDTLVPCCLATATSRCGAVDDQGNPTFTLCKQPKKNFYWDGSHPTDAGWKAVVSLYTKGTNFTQTSPNLRDFIAS